MSAGRAALAPGEGESGALLLELPATSANLGPGFDTLALALSLSLKVKARRAQDHRFSIRATGRDTAICSRLEGNLLLETYKGTLAAHGGREAPPLALEMDNGIPLGMGCGSSAASRLAGVVLAAHFGCLRWSRERILAEAARLEGHPDNAAACWLGGFVASGWQPDGAEVAAVSLAPPAAWRALLVLPAAPLATTASRSVLPRLYSREDSVLNLQSVALLTAAFATGNADLLLTGTRDRLHQPFRAQVCSLLTPLLGLAGTCGILSVTLSGAGPAVLLLLGSEAAIDGAAAAVRAALDASGDGVVGKEGYGDVGCELLPVSLRAAPAQVLDLAEP